MALAAAISKAVFLLLLIYSLLLLFFVGAQCWVIFVSTSSSFKFCNPLGREGCVTLIVFMMS